MNYTPLCINTTYKLLLPDGRLLGRVRVERMVDGWAEGPFTPMPLFEQYRELFEREARLRYDQIIPLWEQASDAIEELQIEVEEEERDAVHLGLRVFVEGNEAGMAPHSMTPYWRVRQ